MEIRLCKISTYGLKNINKIVEIDFLNETTSRKITSYNVKGVFGKNGSGKTAILESILLYKMLIFKYGYLHSDKAKYSVIKLINKDINEFYFKAYILCTDNGISRIFSHEIKLEVKLNNVLIKGESLSLVKGQTINSSNIDLIYKVENGRMTFYKESTFNSFIYDKTINLLYDDTLIATFNGAYIKHSLASLKKYETNSFDISHFIEPFRILGEKIQVYADTSLVNDDMVVCGNDFKLRIDEDIIPSKKIGDYKNYIKKLGSFLMIFNKELKRIEVDSSIDMDLMHCKKILDYESFSLEARDSSSGIKRLIALYPYLNMAIEGYFVFIDELDTSINNICLNKLIEFFIEYGKGILFFNANSLDLINTLKKKPRSIIFLGDDLNLVIWTKKGNANPLNYYKEGFIEWPCYNVDYFDFLKVFNME